MPRPQMLARLSTGAGRRLTLVARPAGYGKTTLLSAGKYVASPDRPMAWLTLGKNDNAPVVFWSYVIEAARQVCPDLGGGSAVESWRPAVDSVDPVPDCVPVKPAPRHQGMRR